MSEPIIDFSKFLEKVASKLQENILLEMRDDGAKKLAKMAATTVRREARVAGVRRSTETGTHLGRNAKQKAAREKYGSVLDTEHKVSVVDDRASLQVEIRAGISDGRAHVGRFLSEGTQVNRHNWGRDSGSPVQANNFMTKARKIVDSTAGPIVKKALKKSLKKQVKVKGKKVMKGK